MIQIDEAGAARGPAAAQGANGRHYLDWAVERSGSLLVRRARRDADPHPHVLLGVQRHHRRHRRDGRRRDLDRDLALRRWSCSTPSGTTAIRTRSAPASTTSIRRACPRSTEMTDLHQARAAAALRRAALDQSGLRVEDPQMGRGAARARQHGRRRPRIAGAGVSHPACPVSHPQSQGRTPCASGSNARGLRRGSAITSISPLVGSMWRDGERTVLAFVGGDGRAYRGRRNARADSWPLHLRHALAGA